MLTLPSIAAHDAEPVSAENPAYQTRIAYRTDDYSSLRYKLLRHLEEAFPRWNRTLADKEGEQDFGVALVEMFSYMAEILGFYQDCRANEAFLRTAVLPSSVAELCALVDYRIPPGAAATTLQAFFCKDGQAGTVPAGFRLKTRPRDARPALTFETAADLNVSAGLNELRLKGFDRSELRLAAPGAPPETSVLLDQGYAGLRPGSFVVITCPARQPIPVQLLAVTDEGEKRRISWPAGALPDSANLPVADVVVLGRPKQQMKLAASARADEIAAGQGSVAVENPAIFAESEFLWFTFRAPAVFVSQGFKQAVAIIGVTGDVVSWAPSFGAALRRSETRVYDAANLVDLCYGTKPGDQTIEVSVGGLRAGDSVVLWDAASAALARISVAGPSSYVLAEPLSQGFPGGALVFSVSLPDPETGAAGGPSTGLKALRLDPATTELVLDQTYAGLVAGQAVVVTDGESTVVRTLSSVDIDASARTVLTLSARVGQEMKIAATTVHGPFELRMRIDGHDRATGSVAAGLTRITLAGRADGLAPGRWLVLEDAAGAEGARIMSAAIAGDDTEVALDAPLSRAFALADTVVLGNVAEVTEGESVVENALGSGDQSQANQAFTLHRKPTTYVHDGADARGVATTLRVFVGDELWKAAESLAESGPDDHCVAVDVGEDGATSFAGGDGRHGAKFPTGVNNVSARYRVGLGTEGNVERDAIALMAAPLAFLRSSRNPTAASGGADPQDLETTRQLAPVTMRTIDRAVTVDDYRELALSYAGVAKANARATRADGRAAIDLVVATSGGGPLSASLKDALGAFLRDRGAPGHFVVIRDFTPVPIRLALEAHVRPTFLRAETGVRIRAALGSGIAGGGRGYFHFDRRGLGESLYLSDVYALVEAVEGVDFLVVGEFRAEADTAAAGRARDVVEIPPDGLATGGDPLDAGVGLLSVALVGGLA